MGQKYTAAAGRIKKLKNKPDQTKFAGDLSVPVQVNITVEQKEQLVARSKELGVPLATLIRMKTFEALGSDGVTIFLSPDLHAKLLAASEKAEVSLSTFIRDVLKGMAP